MCLFCKSLPGKMFLLVPPDWSAGVDKAKESCPSGEGSIGIFSYSCRSPARQIHSGVCGVKPPPNNEGITIGTGSWIEAVVQGIPVLKDVDVSVSPPAGSEVPTLESITVQAADEIDKLVFCQAPSCIMASGMWRPSLTTTSSRRLLSSSLTS